jgi:threonine synthase
MMGLPIKRLILATNENNVLDEFFQTGIYRPRSSAQTHITSSPSMDISKASNFERFVFDLVGRDATVVRNLWQAIDTGGAFDLNATPFMQRLPEFGFVSGSSTHADRLATIREIWQKHQIMIDTHTADGVKVAQDHRISGVPTIILETAQAIKFAETIREALGREPIRPAALEGLESLPQKVTTLPADTATVKAFVAAHC